MPPQLKPALGAPGKTQPATNPGVHRVDGTPGWELWLCTAAHADGHSDRKTDIVDGIGTTNYTYDNANRLTQVEGPYKTVSYGYDNGGRRTSLGLTGQNSVSYSYNAADYLTSLTNANSETTSWTYNDVGLPTRQDNANSTYAEWTYDANRYWKKSGEW